jgi:hypothetical protein
MEISGVRPDEYERAADLWEASVRATHDFVTEADIEVFRPLVRAAFGNIEHLAGLRDDDGLLIGFYLHHGFRVVSRAETDSTNKPYPILHLILESVG